MSASRSTSRSCWRAFVRGCGAGRPTSQPFSGSVGQRSTSRIGATVEGRTVELSAREFALAEAFFRHPGQVLSRQQLFEHAWGHGDEAGSNLVEVYVSHLRQKLGDSLIKTIHRLGYRLET
jgi:DNA-binding response OmpR family regulator